MAAYPKPRVLYDTFSSPTIPDTQEPTVLKSHLTGRVLKPEQSVITSLGTLNELNVDDINFNSNYIHSLTQDLVIQAGNGSNKILVNNDIEIVNGKSIYTPTISTIIGNLDLVIGTGSNRKIKFNSGEVVVSSLLKVLGELRCDTKIKAQSIKLTTQLTSEIANGSSGNLILTTLNNSGDILLNSNTTIHANKTLSFTKCYGNGCFKSFNDDDGINLHSRAGFIVANNPTNSGAFTELRFQHLDKVDWYGETSNWDYTFQRKYSTAYIKTKKLSTSEKTLFRFKSSNSTIDVGNSSNDIDVDVVGDCEITGTLSKGAGTFSIPHPAMKETHLLKHSFVEAPRMDLIYRSSVRLFDGKMVINLDEKFKMSEGTFIKLNRDISVFTFNEETYDHIRGKVEANILTIESQNESSNALVTFMVIGERKDDFVKGKTNMTDDDGNFIPEIRKPLEEDDEDDEYEGDIDVE